SEMNIYGGIVSSGLEIENQSTLNMFGGVVNGGITARTGSFANITGGSLPNYFSADGASSVNISGGEFLLDGAPIDGLQTDGASRQFDPPYGSRLSGTLADGTPFLIDKGYGFTWGTLTLHSVALPPIGPTQLQTSTDPLPSGLRSGQTLTVDSDATT